MTTLTWNWVRGIRVGLYNAVVQLEERLAVVAVPAGGTTGQVLTKSSDLDHATTWDDAGTSSGGLTHPQILARTMGA